MADLCSLEDAFPNIDSGTVHKKGPYAGGTDDFSSKAERRAARKKAKRCKGPALKALEAAAEFEPVVDPDRPATVRMEQLVAMGKEEAAKGGMEAFKLPTMPSSNCLFSDPGYPAYFGKGEDEEGFSAFAATPGDDPNYRLEPDVTKTFDTKGVEKAMGSPMLPDPNLSDRWKPMTESGTYTAYYDSLPSVIASKPGWATAPRVVKAAEPIELDETPAPPIEAKPSGDIMTISKSEKEDMTRKMNDLIGRLEQLEKKRVQNTQTEILLFVGTGVFLLAAFELLGRRRR